MQTRLGKLSIVTVTVLFSTLFHIAGASRHFGSSPLLIPRDQTCSDGGVCLSGPGFTCCPSSEPGTGGCMWTGSVCCGYGQYCGPNQFCSPPNNGQVNCCYDSACSTVVDIGIPVIAYTDQSLFTSETAAATATTTSESSAKTTKELTTSAKTTSSTTNGSPAATKTSAGILRVQLDLIAGILVPLAMLWILLGTQM